MFLDSNEPTGEKWCYFARMDAYSKPTRCEGQAAEK